MTHLPPISESLPDHPPMPAFHQVRSLKAGPLTKQGSLFKSWKKRLFILQDAFLMYYVTAEDTSPRGALWIKECVVREEPDVSRLQSAKMGQATYCFSLLCHKSWNIEAKRVFKERSYLLLADSFAEMSDWMAILRTMSRASADIDAEFEQSYAAFAAMPGGAGVPVSGANSADHSAQNAGTVRSSASLEGVGSGRAGKHRRGKSKSGSGSQSIYSGGHARSASITAHQTQHSDGSGSSGSLTAARPRTPLASSVAHSLSLSSSAGAPGSILFAARASNQGGGLAAGAGAGSGGGGGNSITGGGMSYTTGTGTPRASISHSLSDSRSSLTHNSITQRQHQRTDTDDENDGFGGLGGGGGGTGEHTPRAGASAAMPLSSALPLHPSQQAAGRRGVLSTSPPTTTTTAASLSSHLQRSHHSPSSSLDADAAAAAAAELESDDLGDLDHRTSQHPSGVDGQRSHTPLAGQSRTPRQQTQQTQEQQAVTPTATQHAITIHADIGTVAAASAGDRQG